MAISELRDTEHARQFLAQGLWLQRVVPPAAAGVSRTLQWALEIASEGAPLPPVGFIADIGHLVLGHADEPAGGDRELAVPGVSHALLRAYEDYVLGKLYADGTFERAADAVAHYKSPRDRARGLAFLVNQFRERAGFGGVLLSPGVVKRLLAEPAEAVLAAGWDALATDGLLPLLAELYDELTHAVRNTGDVLGPEDVFELEHGTALAEFGQRVALRQVLTSASRFEQELPRRRPVLPARRQEVPTRLFDDDAYPIGGFTSISNRGTIESLLHSQLAYMEPATPAGDDPPGPPDRPDRQCRPERLGRPDLFDVKFLRDELLYYSRDENQFLRRRRTFVFALYPDLARARVKDAGLPWQRIILLLGLLAALVRKLLDWLDDESLVFELLFVTGDAHRDPPLADERRLLEMLFREPIANGTVAVTSLTAPAIAGHLDERARRSLCQCLLVSTKERPIDAGSAIVHNLRLGGSSPGLCDAEGHALDADAEATTPWDRWRLTLETLLETWL